MSFLHQANCFGHFWSCVSIVMHTPKGHAQTSLYYHGDGAWFSQKNGQVGMWLWLWHTASWWRTCWHLAEIPSPTLCLTRQSVFKPIWPSHLHPDHLICSQEHHRWANMSHQSTDTHRNVHRYCHLILDTGGADWNIIHKIPWTLAISIIYSTCYTFILQYHGLYTHKWDISMLQCY